MGYKGDFKSPFVIVGESPGAMELYQKIPFVGPAGELLDSVLNPLRPHMDGIEPFITNAINCMPRQKDPNRLGQACQRCNGRLVTELQAHPRKVILALGNAALWSLTGNYNLKITQVRGQTFASTLAEKGIVAAVHPSFLLRGGGNLQQWQRDWKMAVELLTGKEVKANAPSARMKTTEQFVHGKYTILTTPEEVTALAFLLKKVPVIAADIETDGFNPRQGSIISPAEYDGTKCIMAAGVRCTGKGILSIGICYERGHSYVIPGDLITNELFENEAEWCWHNGKYDCSWLREYECDSARVDDDTMLMSYVLNERGGVHDLEQVGGDWLQAPNYKGMLDQYRPTKAHSYAYIPKEVLYKYQAIDTELTFWLRGTLRKAVETDKYLAQVYERILIPASEFLLVMEQNGFYTDLDRVAENEQLVGQKADALEKMFMAEAAKYGFADINMRSPKQLQEYLYGHHKMRPMGTSTDADTLERLLMVFSKDTIQYGIVRNLLDYRKVQKLLSTYIVATREKMDVTDHRMHSTYKLHGTTTGRLSSNEPNMQNVPRDPQIRGQWISSPGRALLDIDLAQAELRMLACLSKDEAMVRIFNSGLSLHDEVAEYLFGKGFNKEQKMIAKNINFGIIYGISPHGLQDQIELGAMLLGSVIHVTKQECQEWIDGWFQRFPQAAKFIQLCRNAPNKGQTLQSFTGRKRRFGVVGFENLNALQNEAANFPHQSGAHDICLMAGIQTYTTLLEEHDCGYVNEVHDNLIAELPNDMWHMVMAARKITSAMEEIPKVWGLTAVPFKAESEIGNRWGYCTKFDPWKYTDEQLTKMKGIPYEEVINQKAA